jgi:Xaa-Pro aminopeptidase
MSIAAKSLRPGITELEIAYLAEQRMIELGSDRMRHMTSVASGPRTKLVHAFATRKKIEAGEMVAIDLGAVIQGYCSDLARTFVIGGPDDDLKAAFGVFRDAQDQVIQKLTTGKAIDEIQALPRDIVKAAGYPMVGHIGHNIGLGIEEHPFLMGAVTPDPEATARENNVLAFFQGSIKREGKVNLGIRLEDTVLVTAKGARLLTSYPRELIPV